MIQNEAGILETRAMDCVMTVTEMEQVWKAVVKTNLKRAFCAPQSVQLGSCSDVMCNRAMMRREAECKAEKAATGPEGRQADLKRAFSAPRICTVLAGCLARFSRLPA